ncbi:MAG TPA: HlyD family efflux transporter periplasmic adaptor subunit [Tepidisphaeraceae bacterium]|nr:HlyD family efflux transporter periplasmic adaptor subunit [Tepidisphaeraceae bacterium]
MASGIVESSSQGNEGQQQTGISGGVSRSKLVQRLLATTANLPGFINDLIHTQAVVVAGTEAAGFLIERTTDDKGEPQFGLRPIAHIRPDNSSAETRAAAITAFQGLVGQCVAQGKDGALEVGAAGGDMVDAQFCLVTLLRNDGEVVAASAVITRCRDTERAQQRLTSMQLVAGYFDLYTLKRTSEQARMIAQSHQHVLQLATAVATAQGFQAAAMNLCNELATRTGASRVSIGWLKNERVRVKALSHTEEFDKRQELIVQIERAMEECLDQDEVVQFEPDGTSSENVTREAQALSRSQGGNSVISLPLRRQAEIIGVLTLEFAPGSQLGPQAANGLSVAADLLAPQLYDRHENDRWMITKVGLSAKEGYKGLIGPKHWLAKTLVAFLLFGLYFISPWSFYKPMYQVVAPFSFAPSERRYVSAPFEGFIKEVHVRPGDAVQGGKTVLFELDTTELRKEMTRALGEANTAEKAYWKYMGERPPKVAEANIEREKRAAALAEADLFQFRIDHSVVKADIDGEVLEGDLKDKKNSPVKLGDQLMVIGQPDKLRGELRVAERDVQNVKANASGKLAITSLPQDRFPFKVERVVPSTEAKDGGSHFKVIVAIDPSSKDWPVDESGKKVTPPWLPGMEGEARVDVAPTSLGWKWTHRLIEFVRLKLWI